MRGYILSNIEIGERIREIRKKQGMSREAFSEMINISEIFLGQIERGERSLSITTLASISFATGVSTEYILFGVSENNTTMKKIINILEKSPDNMREYVYKILLSSFSFFKSIKEESKK